MPSIVALAPNQAQKRAVADVTLSEEDFVLFNEDDMVLQSAAGCVGRAIRPRRP